jgi:hypothetical protein
MAQVDVKATRADGTICRLKVDASLFDKSSSIKKVHSTPGASLNPQHPADISQLQALFASGPLTVRVSGTRQYVPLSLSEHGPKILELKRARLCCSQKVAKAKTKEDPDIKAFLDANGTHDSSPANLDNETSVGHVNADPATPGNLRQARAQPAVNPVSMPASWSSAPESLPDSCAYISHFSQPSDSSSTDKAVSELVATVSAQTLQLAGMQAAIERLTHESSGPNAQQETLKQLIARLDEQLAFARSERPTFNGRSGKSSSHHGHCQRPSKADGVKHYEVEQIPYRHNATCDTCNKMIVGSRFKCLKCPDFDLCDSCYKDVRTVHPKHRFVRVTGNDIQPWPKQSDKTPSFLPSTAPRGPRHNGVLCDGIGCRKNKQPIMGARFKCAVCPDFDLCEACEASPLSSHELTHPLIKYKVPKNQCVKSAPAAKDEPAVTDDKHVGASNAVKKGSVDAEKDESRLPEYTSRVALANSEKHQPEASDQRKCSSFTPNKLLDKPTQNGQVPSIMCDGCLSVVDGNRFVCVACDDFDLCDKCVGTVEHDPKHLFVRVGSVLPEMPISPVKAAATKYVQCDSLFELAFACDICGKDIANGECLKCMQCDDYDLCLPCSENAKHAKDHDMILVPSTSTLRKRFVSSPNVTSVAPTSAFEKQQPQNLTSGAHQGKVTHTASILTTTPKAAHQDSALEATFIEDVSIPDGTVVSPGSQLVKQWSLKNTGAAPWPLGISAVFVGGVVPPTKAEGKLSTPQLESAVAPGSSAVVSVMLQAPAEEQDNVVSYWQLCTPAGMKFGPRLWVDVDVQQHEQPRTASVGTSVSTSQSSQTTGSRLVFPSASMELPGSHEHGTLSSTASEARSQRGHNIDDIETLLSDDEIDLSDETDYELLQDESLDGYE